MHTRHARAAAYSSLTMMLALGAIFALTGGKFFGWTWLDPVMGIVGSGVIARPIVQHLAQRFKSESQESELPESESVLKKGDRHLANSLS